MMTTLNITVFNNRVLIDNPIIIPEGNLNTIFAVFELPDEWNGLTAKVKFGNAAPITIPSSKTVTIPIFAAKGDISVKVFAYSLANDEYSLIHSPAPTQITICEGSFDNSGETPAPPIPVTEYLDKATLWNGYSAFFESLSNVPEDIETEFNNVDITSMTLEQVITKIEEINKMIMEAYCERFVTLASDQEISGKKSFICREAGMLSMLDINAAPDLLFEYTTRKEDSPNETNIQAWIDSEHPENSYVGYADKNGYCEYKIPKFNDDLAHTFACLPITNADIANNSVTEEKLSSAVVNKLNSIPTNNNQLINGAGYQTASDVTAAIISNRYAIRFEKDISNQWTCDKTFAEIESAILAQKRIVAVVKKNILGIDVSEYWCLSVYIPNQSVVFSNIDSGIEMSLGITNTDGILYGENIIQDKTYVHTQTASSDTWTITHNLNKYPSVTVTDSAKEEVVGDVKYDSLNQVTIKFNGAFKGIATLN